MTATTLARDVFAEFPLVSNLTVIERPDQVTVYAALPSVKPEDVSVTARGNVLTIRGERTLEGPKRIYRFTRSTPLPRRVRETGVTTAAFHDGLLEVIVPLEAGPPLDGGTPPVDKAGQAAA